jgi:hypothetical protein
MKKSTFHITYFLGEEKLYSKGQNVIATTMLGALMSFNKLIPDARVFTCIDKGEIAYVSKSLKKKQNVRI